VAKARSGSIEELDVKIGQLQESQQMIEKARNQIWVAPIEESTGLNSGEENQLHSGNQKTTATSKRKPHFDRGHVNAVGRTEALRRMKRGMAIAQALRGHPAVFMLQQISTLAQNRK